MKNTNQSACHNKATTVNIRVTGRAPLSNYNQSVAVKANATRLGRYHLLTTVLAFITCCIACLTPLAQAQSSALTSVMDTHNGTPDVFFLDTNGDVHVEYFNGQWNQWDVTKYLGIKPAAIGSALTSLFDSVNTEVDMFYLDTNGHLNVISFADNTGQWSWTDMTMDAPEGAQLARNGTALTSGFDSINGTPDVFYVDENGQVDILYKANGHWHFNGPVLGIPEVTAAIEGSGLTSIILSQSSGGSPYVFVFYTGSDGFVNVLDFSPGGWGSLDTQLPPESFQSPLVAASPNLVFYFETNGDLVDLADYLGNSPTPFMTDLTSSYGTPAAALGSDFRGVLIGGLSFMFYLPGDQTSHIELVDFRGQGTIDGYETYDLMLHSAAPGAAAGSPLTSVVDTARNVVHVVYWSVDGNRHDLSSSIASNGTVSQNWAGSKMP